MKRIRKTSGKKSKAKASKAGLAIGRKTAEAKRRIVPAAKSKGRSVADLTKELKEAREQQAASAEILYTIASATGDAEQSLQRIAETTERLFRAQSVTIRIAEGDEWVRTIRVGAGSKRIGSLPAAQTGAKARNLPGTVYRENQQIHIPDLDNVDPAMADWPMMTARAEGIRTISGTPLRREGKAIGALVVYRDRLAPFTGKELALQQSFADQAVIAIQNARLFNETKEALERQIATADILKVIASSPSDVQPVFEAIAASANRLIGGFSTAVLRFIGDELHLAAFTPTNEAADEALKASFPRPHAEFPVFKLVRDGKAVEYADTESEDLPPLNRDLARLRGYRSMLFTPLMSGETPVGMISVTRKKTGKFAPHHVQLVRTFADQAVIAIENARLFDEVQAKTRDLTESLQQQTATADVLKVISRSAFDLQKVLETLIQSAVDLSGALRGVIYLREGELFRFQAASYSDIDPAWLQFMKDTPQRAGRRSIVARAILTAQTVCIPDFLADAELQTWSTSLAGIRGGLAVPLIRDGQVEGVLALSRPTPGPFSERQIELVQTFADQAVIAIENARLFGEVQRKSRDLGEALTYQTQSSNILSVIASSPTDVGPVLAAIVKSACEICNAYDANVLLKDGDDLRYSAHQGPIPIGVEGKWSISRNWVTGRAVVDKVPIHVHDLQSAEGAEFPVGREHAQRQGHRTILSVPLLRETESIGAIVLRRAEVNPFSEKQIALLQTFADQAVIAIENARLFSETKEALERQTATADILKVIASSPTDVQPVFEAIAERSNRLVAGFSTSVFSLVDDMMHLSAFTRTNPAADEALKKRFPSPLSSRSWGEQLRNGETVLIPDTEVEGAVSSDLRNSARMRGYRSMVHVPLLRERTVIGLISVTRVEPGPFPSSHVKLLQTFADQAVIAISNGELFQEVQAKTRDLTESLQQQTATADVLKVISRSAFDLEAVMNTLAHSASELCGASLSTLQLREGDFLIVRGIADIEGEFADFLRENPIPVDDQSYSGRAVLTGSIANIADATSIGTSSNTSKFQKLLGYKSILLVPLMREGRSIGLFSLARYETGAFSPRDIELVQTFADQAVIAIENVRLFDEVQERTKELAASLDDLRKAQDRLVQTEKLASLGQLTAGIAHEIKNPLNFVNNFSTLSAELTDELNDVLRSAVLTDKMREEVDELTAMLKDNLEKVVQHGKRADSIVKNMLLHSREGSGEHRSVEINALVDESLNLAYHGARAEKPGFNIDLKRDFDPAVGVADIYPQEMTRVLLNLISNGFYATAKRNVELGDDFEPVLTATTKNMGDKIEIRIRDNGTGIPAEVKEKIFNPFFTTKPAGEGTGLGLSMSHDIVVKQHGGTIDVETQPGQFTEFKIVLPRTGASLTKSGQTT